MKKELAGARVLVTGGAGFIGTHLVNQLLDASAEVRIVDSFDEQVHGAAPHKLEGPAELVVGDVRDPELWERALDGITYVVHLAAAVGVGQSMYEVHHYCDVNVLGTARMIEALSPRKESIQKVLVASSMSIYGEGLYNCPDCNQERSEERDLEDLREGRWEPRCPVCGGPLALLPTPETKVLRSSSVYAINKKDQEELSLVSGKAYGIPTVAMRFFNVYGPGQALSNPYTGVAAIFASRLLADAPPLIFEDGKQSRDFIHVSDIARACVMALADPSVRDVALNLGTGRSFSVIEMAELLRKELGGPEPEILGTFRQGDIRHCVADITLARKTLGWEPEIKIEQGIVDLLEWVKTQTGSAGGQESAVEELRKHGLVL